MKFVLALSVIWASLQLLLLVGNQLLCFGCLHEEREVLLYLKSSANATEELDSWGKEEDCCTWERVNCNNVTRRITHLHLNFINSDYDWDSDFSSFVSLAELSYLDLSDNNIVSSLKSKALSSLNKIRCLDLSSNLLNGSLASTGLSELKNIELLRLADNYFSGALPLTLNNLTTLRSLHLESNFLTGDISAEAFSGLVNLTNLYLNHNSLNGSLRGPLSNLPNLKTFDVSHNSLSGTIPNNYFANLTSLYYVDVSWNSLSGEFLFFPSFANHTSLEDVDFSSNNALNIKFDQKHCTRRFQLKLLAMSNCSLEPDFSSLQEFLSTQSDIDYIDFSHNKLQGTLTNLLFENKTKLSYINLRNNLLGGTINLAAHRLFELLVIDFSVNLLEGFVLQGIQIKAFPNLIYFNLSHNNFSGSIPSSICSIGLNRIWVTSLDLSNNNFSGKIPSCMFTSLFSVLILSNNNLTGKLYGPSDAMPYSRLEILDISGNNLSGRLPKSIGEMSYLAVLNIRDNSFQGNLPHQLCKLTNLMVLDLANNNFSGFLPQCSGTLYNLQILNLGGNDFKGQMPGTLFDNSSIKILDATNNNFFGTMDWVCDLKNISVLLLSRNYFEGPLISKRCELQNFRLLDVSDNKLSGQIPTSLGNILLQSVGGFSDAFMWLETSVIEDLVVEVDVMPHGFEFTTKGNNYLYQRYILNLMIGFDLSKNKFSGKIPPELGKLSKMKSLNLSYNQLTGSIPEALANITEIESLDLSNNRLTGPIPKQFVLLKSLEFFSVAFNNLSGCTPEMKDQFETFNSSSYIGNPDLHGPPLDETCSATKAEPNPEEEEYKHDVVDDAIMYAIAAASFVFAFWACIFFLYRTQTGWRIRVRFVEPYVDSLF